MSDEYPLYPEPSEAGKEEAQKLIDQFKVEIKKAADNVIGQMYCDVVPHIESDSWTNYRNAMMDGFRNYDNRMVMGEHDFKNIRAAIYKEYRDEIIVDLNQDMVEEIEALKNQIVWLNNAARMPC